MPVQPKPRRSARSRPRSKSSILTLHTTSLPALDVLLVADAQTHLAVVVNTVVETVLPEVMVLEVAEAVEMALVVDVADPVVTSLSVVLHVGPREVEPSSTPTTPTLSPAWEHNLVNVNHDYNHDDAADFPFKSSCLRKGFVCE